MNARVQTGTKEMDTHAGSVCQVCHFRICLFVLLCVKLMFFFVGFQGILMREDALTATSAMEELCAAGDSVSARGDTRGWRRISVPRVEVGLILHVYPCSDVKVSFGMLYALQPEPVWVLALTATR